MCLKLSHRHRSSSGISLHMTELIFFIYLRSRIIFLEGTKCTTSEKNGLVTKKTFVIQNIILVLSQEYCLLALESTKITLSRNVKG